MEPVVLSGVMQDLGYADRGKNYPMKRNEHWTMLNESSMNVRLLNLPPLIRPEKMPKQIVGSDYDLIKTILVGYRKSGMGWDDYARKLEPDTRRMLESVFFECRCNGFFNPEVTGDALTFQQTLKTDKPMKYELTVKDMKGEYDERNHGAVE